MSETGRLTAWVVVFEGWADHETGLACAEIRAHGGVTVRYAGVTSQPVLSATGLSTVPDCTAGDITPDGACILILPGGPLWEERDVPEVTEAVRTFREREIPIAAIGSGTLVFARAGVLGGYRHTSNGLAWLKERVPEYRDDLQYVNVVDVADGGLVTANSGGIVDFAHEIIKLLDLRDEPDRRTWYRLHREGVLPIG